MGKNMLHTRSQLLEMTGPLRQGLVLEERRLPQSLPDVAGATTVNGGVAVAADIYINKVSGGDLCLLQLHGQLIDNAPPVRFTVFLKGQSRHDGDCGVHCVAPKSIIAWLKRLAPQASSP